MKNYVNKNAEKEFFFFFFFFFLVIILKYETYKLIKGCINFVFIFYFTWHSCCKMVAIIFLLNINCVLSVNLRYFEI